MTLTLYIKPEGSWQCTKTKDPFAKAGVQFDVVDVEFYRGEHDQILAHDELLDPSI